MPIDGVRSGDEAVWPVRVEPQGWTFHAPAATPLVPAAARAGIRLPSSCRNGTCRACRCRLSQGEVAYGLERPGLSPDEREEGWILPCIARPLAPLVLQAPHARTLEAAAPPPAMLTGARR